MKSVTRIARSQGELFFYYTNSSTSSIAKAVLLLARLFTSLSVLLVVNKMAAALRVLNASEENLDKNFGQLVNYWLSISMRDRDIGLII